MLVRDIKKEDDPVKESEPTPPAQDLTINAEATKKLAEAIETLAKRKESQPDLTPVFEAILKLQVTQQAILQKITTQIEPQVKNWEFSVNRDRRGAIETIFASSE
jgi:hypothetical protein